MSLYGSNKAAQNVAVALQGGLGEKVENANERMFYLAPNIVHPQETYADAPDIDPS